MSKGGNLNFLTGRILKPLSVLKNKHARLFHSSQKKLPSNETPKEFHWLFKVLVLFSMAGFPFQEKKLFIMMLQGQVRYGF
jgi:hypothetical protein